MFHQVFLANIFCLREIIFRTFKHTKRVAFEITYSYCETQAISIKAETLVPHETGRIAVLLLRVKKQCMIGRLGRHKIRIHRVSEFKFRIASSITDKIDSPLKRCLHVHQTNAWISFSSSYRRHTIDLSKDGFWRMLWWHFRHCHKRGLSAAWRYSSCSFQFSFLRHFLLKMNSTLILETLTF